MTPQEMGRYLAGLRRRAQKQCVVCGAPIEGTLRRMYCSNRCVKRAYNTRHHDAVLARQRERRHKKRTAQ